MLAENQRAFFRADRAVRFSVLCRYFSRVLVLPVVGGAADLAVPALEAEPSADRIRHPDRHSGGGAHRGLRPHPSVGGGQQRGGVRLLQVSAGAPVPAGADAATRRSGAGHHRSAVYAHRHHRYFVGADVYPRYGNLLRGGGPSVRPSAVPQHLCGPAIGGGAVVVD